MAFGSTADRLEALEQTSKDHHGMLKAAGDNIRDLVDDVVSLSDHMNKGFDKVADRFNNDGGEVHVKVGMSIGALRMECVKLAISGGNNFGAESIAKDADIFFKFIQEGKVPE